VARGPGSSRTRSPARATSPSSRAPSVRSPPSPRSAKPPPASGPGSSPPPPPPPPIRSLHAAQACGRILVPVLSRTSPESACTQILFPVPSHSPSRPQKSTRENAACVLCFVFRSPFRVFFCACKSICLFFFFTSSLTSHELLITFYSILALFFLSALWRCVFR
jgi:hypothetical protein